MKSLNCLIAHILYHIRLFWLYLQKHESVTDNHPIGIYVNKIENRITFRIKTGYYLDLVTPKTKKLLESTKSNITKDEKGENVPHLKISEVVLMHCNIVNKDYQEDSRVLYTIIPNKLLG